MINSVNGKQVDADKEAQSYFDKSKKPQINLLKARLFFDGGYYELALEELQKINFTNSFNKSKNNLEYFYRLGRCMEKIGNDKIAIEYYNKTIKSGFKDYYYYAAKSALQIGLIQERNKNYQEAKIYFNICIDMKNHQYEQSLEQKARAGINRLN